MPRMPKTARKTFALEDTELKTWFERDRAHVDLQDRETGRTLIEFWDEDVEQLLEDGFLDRRNLHDSLYKYAVHLGAIKAPKSSTRHHATKKSPAQLQREIDEVLAKPVAASSKIRLPPGEPAAWAHRHLSKASTPAELSEIWRAMKKPGTGMGAYYASRTGVAQSEINSVYQQHRARLGAA